jgi:pimeloyl-ACP methyl ester carboxylesterase
MPQPFIKLGGNPHKPMIHIAPANGFVPQTYLPMFQTFMDDYQIVSMPPRALWGDGEAPEISLDVTWMQLADDLLAGIEKFGLQDIIAIGHSFGGVASFLAALKKPQYFKALIMLDPVIIPFQFAQKLMAIGAKGQLTPFPLAEGAKRRRNTFDSLEDAFERFREKSVFADWSDDVLRLYVEYGTSQQADGIRQLTWSGAWEAFYYSSYYAEIWDDIAKLKNLDIPMLFIAAGDAETYSHEAQAKVRQLVPHATHSSIEGYGHLFPQSAPQKTARMIREWLVRQALI